MQDRSMYRAHRERALSRLEAEGAAAVVPTAAVQLRSHDSEHRFRPDSDFWHLTGFAEPESVLVLLPRLEARGTQPAREHSESVLFLREKRREEELWTGRRLGVEAAPEALGVTRAYPVSELWERLPELLTGYRRIVYRTAVDEERDRKLLAALARLRAKVRSGAELPAELVDTAPILHELRLLKSEAELARMRRSAAIAVEAHLAAMAAARPGGNEREIEGVLQGTFLRSGASGPAYNPIVAGGANACVLHYNDNDAPLRGDELLLVDAGCEVEHYASDVTRTFPVGGRFSAPQRALYEVVLAAHGAALQRARPGEPFDGIHEAAVERLSQGLLDLGLLEGTLERVLESGSYRRFYMHRTSHWLGLDVHDCGAYAPDGSSRRLEPGMVLTVEPGLYVDPDDAQVDARWRGIGIRLEDDVLITAAGCEVLSAGLPTAPDEVEAACAGRRSARE